MLNIEYKELMSLSRQGKAHLLEQNGDDTAYWVSKHRVTCFKDSLGNWFISLIEETDLPDPSLPLPDSATLEARRWISEYKAGTMTSVQFEERIASVLRQNGSR
jgi:hypothetical protein